ncbi:hypothetical protein SAMN05660461_1767 [Chitinophaga ginsengisegetis]|uniref:Lipoprotein n=1 Tax=Chitinophaga ginsengisegetis TaxID=393003 RepID=A0A1T5NIN2_9BACT|nr:hypothetical protein [Chitinophaga ginsengisegetis]SKD00294.1 hypothetical protein SAMN05660461_1767 [Chitinophaga ginsengisegetis]
MYLNKYLSCLTLAVLLVSCNLDNKPGKYDNEENVAKNNKKNATETATKPARSKAPIVGERINGAATILNNPGGEPLVTLVDYIPLRCAPVKKDWYPVSVDFDITKDEFSKPLFHKGRKIKVNGVDAGVLQRDIKLPVATNGEKMWATINGYTQKKSIRNGTIIESALSSYLKQHTGRSAADMEPFIHNFKLEEETTLKPYVLYFNYESGIDDPSPLYRLALVFQGKQLIGVLHSRPIQLDGGTPRRLQRGFTVNYLNGIDKSLKEDFAVKFNKFILSVD